MRVFVLVAIMLAGGIIVNAAELERWPAPGASGWSRAVKAGRFIHVSSLSAAGADGRLAAADIKGQTRAVLDGLSAAFAQAGTSLSRAASVHVFLRNAGDFQAMNEVYATYWPSDPPVRTTVVTSLSRPDVLVEMSAIGVAAGAPREVVHPAGWVKSTNPYSYGIKSGDTLYLSGLVPRSGKDNSNIQGDIATQTRAVLQNGAAILAAAGMSLSDVVSSRVFITDGANFQAMNTAYRESFPTLPPARATVICGLMQPSFLVEITMVAVSGARHAVTATGADASPRPANPNLSAAVTVADRVFVSGMLGNTPQTRGDVAAQTRETLAALGRTLKSAGVTLAEVTDAIVYLTDMSTQPAMEQAWREVFGQTGPTRTVVGTGLVAPDGLVEIMLNASK